MNKPLVIEIKGNSLDDGPGIRSTIFFKGCPLSCIWCHNPESKNVGPELSYDKKDCIRCMTCAKNCPNNALGNNPTFIDRDKCNLCFKCVDKCPAKGLTRVGKEMSKEEILRKIVSDKPFYDVSNGGVTLSGGEATLCSEWVGELAKDIKNNNINILLETCGYFNFEKVEKYLLSYLNIIYCDIKIYDREQHKKYCGVYNDLILDNFKKMFELKEKYGYYLLPRIPLVPNITDTKENLNAIAKYLYDIGVKEVQLLPYNPTWYDKADKIGVSINAELHGLNHFQEKNKIDEFKKVFTDLGIKSI